MPRVADLHNDAAPHLVADLDPLSADSWMAQLGTLNKHRDTAGLLRATRDLVPSFDYAVTLGPYEAAAATRDLGMMLASLRRHGMEPVEVVPEVEPIMLLWGRRTDMAPRDTTFHYGSWNPSGDRRRRFTSDPTEDGLIDAVATSIAPLRAAADALSAAWELPMASADFVTSCTTTANELLALSESMAITRKCVDPHFFASELRLYFEPIRMGGRLYSGSSGTQLSTNVIDHLLWSSDCTDDVYREFVSETIRYARPKDRETYRFTLGQPSLLTRLIRERDRLGPDVSDQAAHGLLRVFNALRMFRGRHLAIARAAFQAEINVCPVGSAGYAPDLLTRIFDLTQQARGQLGEVAAGRGSYKVSTCPFRQATGKPSR